MAEKEGHSVRVAGSGQAALDALQQEPFDLVLMDVQMPVMDGLQAAELIRKHEAGSARHIPIIALTAHAMSGDAERCREAGMDGYLTKPIRSEALREALDRFLPEHPAEPARQEICKEILLQRLDNDPGLLVEMVDLFLAVGPQLVERIEQACERRDAEALTAAAHAFRGAAGNFGPSPVFEMAGRLEQLSRSGDLAAAIPLCRDLPAQAAALLQRLSGIREEVALCIS